jgi:hypothetical protein
MAVMCPLCGSVILKEPTRSMASQTIALRARGSAAILELIHTLKAAHPRAKHGDITNYLITLYCPIVNSERALSDLEKQQRIEAFAGQVRAQEQ